MTTDWWLVLTWKSLGIQNMCAVLTSVALSTNLKYCRLWHILKGVFVGIQVCFCTNPLWLVKTRLQLQTPNQIRPYTGFHGLLHPRSNLSTSFSLCFHLTLSTLGLLLSILISYKNCTFISAILWFYSCVSSFCLLRFYCNFALFCMCMHIQFSD